MKELLIPDDDKSDINRKYFGLVKDGHPHGIGMLTQDTREYGTQSEQKSIWDKNVKPNGYCFNKEIYRDTKILFSTAHEKWVNC